MGMVLLALLHQEPLPVLPIVAPVCLIESLADFWILAAASSDPPRPSPLLLPIPLDVTTPSLTVPLGSL